MAKKFSKDIKSILTTKVANKGIISGQKASKNVSKALVAPLKPNTHLASEFFVLSILHRLGYNATLTLGNFKAIDINVVGNKLKHVTIDVKGAISATGYWVNPIYSKKHFYVFVSYNNKINEIDFSPEIFVVPSLQLKGLLTKSTSNSFKVSFSALRGTNYRDNWSQLKPYLI